MSELAADNTRATAAFGACWDATEPRARGRGARPTAVVISLAVHAVALLVGAATWHQAPRVETPPQARVRVVMPSRPQLPAAAPAAPAPARATPPPQPAPPKRLTPVPPPIEPQPAPERVATVEQSGQPDAGVALAAEPVVESSSGAPGLAGGGLIGGSSTGSSLGVVEPPPALPPEQRKAMLASYLQEIFRSRIAAHFQYPEEAERLGMEGLVMVRASVLPTGALWSARTLGDCPHRILCTAAERTVRAAAPFPPPPAELGGAISIDVPLNYRLE